MPQSRAPEKPKKPAILTPVNNIIQYMSYKIDIWKECKRNFSGRLDPSGRPSSVMKPHTTTTKTIWSVMRGFYEPFPQTNSLIPGYSIARSFCANSIAAASWFFKSQLTIRTQLTSASTLRLTRSGTSASSCATSSIYTAKANGSSQNNPQRTQEKAQRKQKAKSNIVRESGVNC